MKAKVSKWAPLLGISGLVIALDQIAKWLTVTRLHLGESWEFWPAVSGFIKVTRSFNTGAAFGIFPAGSMFFLIVALVTAVIFIIMYPRLPEKATLARVGIAMVIGGALSNAVDRIRFDHVIDYVHVQLSPTWANISNFADHAITLGVILLLVDQWLSERAERQRDAADSEAGTLVQGDAAHELETESVPGLQLDGDLPRFDNPGQ